MPIVGANYISEPDVEGLDSLGLQPFVPKRFRACASCEFGVKEGNDLVCRRNPPQSTFLAMQTMVPGPMGRLVPGFEIKPFTGFPVMRPDQWCGEYSARG